MRRLAPLLVVAVLATAGGAAADTSPSAPLQTANPLGAVSLPFSLLQPPAQPEQLSFAQLSDIWQRAGAAYGIPWQVLAAINKVESDFGRNMGPSSAGAIGWMQFMPDTWLRWGVDANGDGVADPWNAEDAIFSAARYLAAAGGQQDIAQAVFAYNHAQWYVDEVLQLAQEYGGGGVQVAADLEAVQQQVDAARAAVVAAQAALAGAQQVEQQLTDAENAALGREQATALLSARLELEKQVGLADARRAAAHAVVVTRQTELAKAQAALADAQAKVQASSFAPGAATAVGGASYAGDYVFPVGGGPSVVSVAHTHHDYPAADIAAPEGSPVYALTDGVVERAWTDDPTCGTGFTIDAADGKVWTYCHLEVLDPSVTAGASLAAGQPVGLVGHTGDATGPHLHLQLQPATEFPQDEPWFASFAGRAFSWQDAPTPTPQALTFAVLPQTDAAAPAPAPTPAQPVTPLPAPGETFAAAPGTPAGGVVYFTR